MKLISLIALEWSPCSFIWRIQDNKDWNKNISYLAFKSFRYLYGESKITRIETRFPYLYHLWYIYLYGESKITRIETYILYLYLQGQIPFIWRIQDNKDWNRTTSKVSRSRSAFIWRIQDNKDWNTRLENMVNSQQNIYMENPR